MLKQLVRRGFLGLGLDLRVARKFHIDNYQDQATLLRGRPVRTVFDVGASYGGTVAGYRRLFPEAHVYAFEPTDAPFAQLTKQFAADGKVTLTKAAVGEQVGSANLHMNAFDQTNSLLPNDEGMEKIVDANQARQVGETRVQVMTIDSFCAEKEIATIDLLKLDVQGFELMVLRGASRMLDIGIPLIATEVLFSPQYKGQCYYEDLALHLREKGYRLYGLYALGRGLNGGLAWADAIFLRNDLYDRLQLNT